MNHRVYLLVRNKYTASMHLRVEDAQRWEKEVPLPENAPDWYEKDWDGIFQVRVPQDLFVKVAESKFGVDESVHRHKYVIDGR